MKDGGSAFPVPENVKDYRDQGMKLRDWFAGQALAGLYANTGFRYTPDGYAFEAYKVANAMIAEREKEQDD
jgi:hypothetical protein